MSFAAVLTWQTMFAALYIQCTLCAGTCFEPLTTLSSVLISHASCCTARMKSLLLQSLNVAAVGANSGYTEQSYFHILSFWLRRIRLQGFFSFEFCVFSKDMNWILARNWNNALLTYVSSLGQLLQKLGHDGIFCVGACCNYLTGKRDSISLSDKQLKAHWLPVEVLPPDFAILSFVCSFMEWQVHSLDTKCRLQTTFTSVSLWFSANSWQ